MIGYVATVPWNSRTLVSESSLSDSTQSPTSPRVISLHLCKLDNVSAMTTQAKARTGQSDETLISFWFAGGRPPFLLLVIDSGVASKLHRHEQEAIALAAIRKLRRRSAGLGG
jgi:hypothetical protein